MIGSRVNAFLCALALSLSSSSAFAADPEAAAAPPRGLTPPPTSDEPADDASPAQAESAPTEQTLPAQAGQPLGPRVTATELRTIDPSGAGLLSAGTGGFSSTLWSGSPRTAINARLAQLPAAPNSPTMRSLMKRVLLTGATPPQGVTPPDEPSFLALRLQRLNANGMVNEASMLGAQSSRDDAFARQAWAESLLLQGRDGDACGDTTTPQQGSSDAYWLKLRTLCHIMRNETQPATLTLDIMRERGVDDDAFMTLATALVEGGKADIKALPAPSGVHLALLRQANKAPPAALATWVPATLALLQVNDAEMRLAASERAAAAGLIPPDQLRDIYNAESFTADQLDDPEAAAAKLSPARANALYYQAIWKRTLPAAKATAFAAALQRAEAQNRFALFAAVADEQALVLKPSPQTAWLAPYIARVLLHRGRDKAAEQWLTVLTSPSDGPTVNAIQIQLGIARPSTENLARMQGAMTWLGQNALKAGGAKDWLMERATREIPLLEALGYIVPGDAAWATSANTAGVVPSGASAEALTALTRAAQENRLGETVLNALVALGVGGPTRAQGQTNVRVIKALMQVGLRDEARAIAVEAALGAPVRLRK